MFAWLKKWWKAVVAGLAVVGAFVAGILLAKKSGRICDTEPSGIPGSSDAGTRASSGLAELESGQREAEVRVGELAKSAEATGRTLDSAEAKLDRLDELLKFKDD